MSVTSAMYTGVSGLLSNSEAMSIIGNNISNINTVGFKSARTIFADKLAECTGDFQVGTGTKVQAAADLFTQGSSQQSANVTDLMISGNSFFALAAPSVTSVDQQDKALLSRAGAFHVDSKYTLVNPQGYQVLDTEGNPIVFDSGEFGSITRIGQDGLITYVKKDGLTEKFYSSSGQPGADKEAATLQRIAVVTVPDPTALQKVGGTLYKSIPAAGVSSDPFDLKTNTANGSSEKIVSNALESSTADMAKEFLSLILTQRAYSANSRTITTADQMTQEVLGLIR